jgi:3-hydroxyisobutyrate dehydrogenase
MAMNLREKMPASHTLVIQDTNVDAMKRFVEEVRELTKSKGAASNSIKLEVANNAREVAEKSVSISRPEILSMSTIIAVCSQSQ